jgi:integrase
MKDQELGSTAERRSMQNGSVIRAERQRGPDVWEFRWREPGADGKRKHRRMVLGSVEQLADEAAARQAIFALRLELDRGGAWLKTRSTTVSDLVSHYRKRELVVPDTVWKTHSTKVTYEGYLNKWILPRWERYPLVRVNAGEVELRLRSLPLARSSCAKIRNLMSVVFNHGIRHDICDRNPIQLVRQSAKRKAVPVILSPNEVQKLISVLRIRERTLVLLAFGTGLRMSELFGLKWHDIDFQRNEISVSRSIVFQVVGPCKTEASQKPVPLDSRLAKALKIWRHHTSYREAADWVFAAQRRVGKGHIGGSASCER